MVITIPRDPDNHDETIRLILDDVKLRNDLGLKLVEFTIAGDSVTIVYE